MGNITIGGESLSPKAQKRLDDWLDRQIEREHQMVKNMFGNVGDTIKCHDANEAIELEHLLLKEGIETDYLYEKDGQKGLWLEVTKVCRA